MLIEFDAAGAPLGIESTAPSAVAVTDINAVIAKRGLEAIGDEERAPNGAA